MEKAKKNILTTASGSPVDNDQNLFKLSIVHKK